MPHNETIALSGTIQHVFAHRFTFLADGETYLADLTPRGRDLFPLHEGLIVSLEGERRPSEIKVTRISTDGRPAVAIEHKKPHHPPGQKHADRPADPALSLAAAKDAGWTTRSDPRRKPKHFEILGRREGGPWTELHVDFAGAIYKQKPANAEKWALDD